MFQFLFDFRLHICPCSITLAFIFHKTLLLQFLLLHPWVLPLLSHAKQKTSGDNIGSETIFPSSLDKLTTTTIRPSSERCFRSRNTIFPTSPTPNHLPKYFRTELVRQYHIHFLKVPIQNRFSSKYIFRFHSSSTNSPYKYKYALWYSPCAA